MQRLTKECDRDDPGPNNSRREPKLRFRTSGLASLLLALPHEPAVYSSPERVRGDTREHPNQQTQECESNLRDAEAMVVAEYERKGAKEEVQDTQQDCRQDAKTQALDHNSQSTNHGLTKRGDPP